MLEIQIAFQIIQIIITLIIALVGWKISVSYNKAQIREINQKYKPYLIITKLINNSTKENNDTIFCGSKVPTVSYKKIVDAIELQKEGLNNKFVNNIGGNDLGTVHHMMYKGDKHLVFNFLKNKQDIVFDCAPTIIVIKNIGYDLCNYCIIKVLIHYKNGGCIQLMPKDKWQQKYVHTQEEFCLILSMVTNNNNLTLCDISGLEEESKITLNQRVDLLEIDFSNNFLDYNRMEIFFLAKSSLANEYLFKITILVEGDRLLSFTEELSIKNK